MTVLPEAEIILPLEGLIDKEAERRKLQKSLTDLERQMGGLRAKLANESFTARAPAEVVRETRAKLAELEVAERGGCRRVETSLRLLPCVDLRAPSPL